MTPSDLTPEQRKCLEYISTERVAGLNDWKMSCVSAALTLIDSLTLRLGEVVRERDELRGEKLQQNQQGE